MANTAQVWSLDSYFPAFDGDEFRKFKADLARELASQLALAAAEAPLKPGNAGAWAGIFAAWEGLRAREWHLDSYISCLGAADSANEAYQAESASLATLQAESQKIR